MAQDLRQFIYLDSGAVNSLLASMFMTVPETVREVAEESQEQESETGAEAGLNLGSLLNFGGSHSQSTLEGNRNLSEVRQRVNDQYRFAILADTVESEEVDISIRELDAKSDIENLETGDLVRVSGSCQPDPLYPLLSALLYFAEATSEAPDGSGFWAQLVQNTSQLGQIGQFYQLLYHGWIGLEIDSPVDEYSVATTVNVENMWVDEGRTFRSQNEYTVFGRVREITNENSIWDIIEVLRLIGTVSSDEEIANIRAELVAKILDAVEEENDTDFQPPEMAPDDFVLEGKSIIIDPIAIYW